MVLDGKKLRDELLIKYREHILKNNLKIKLAIIEVGNNEASNIYIKNKVKCCKDVNIETEVFKLDEGVTYLDVSNLIDKLNNDKNITGIILQSPIPKHLDYDKLSNLIKSCKDVDGFTKENVYRLYLNKKGIIPCTVKGIIRLLEDANITLEGKNVVIVGRGNIVGKPLAIALENKNATVTLCHSKTLNLKEITKNSDILIAACGVHNLITEDMVTKDEILIDVGISKIDGKIVGDITDEAKKKSAYYTPNPGGVGPMTVAMIIDNLIEMKEGENNG